MSYNSLSNCVSSISASVSLLDESIRTLDNAANDLARLKKVLSIEKVYGLVPESDLENAKENIKQEMKPQIGNVLTRIRRELISLGKQKMAVESRIGLQRQRLESAGVPVAAAALVSPRVFYKGDVTDRKLMRLRLLQNKKERLMYSLSRHTLESKRVSLSSIPSLQPSAGR